MSWWVYMVRTENGKLYTGIAKDVDARFVEHCEGNGAKFFRSAKPVAVVYREEHAFKGEALSRENAIKQLTKKQKESLVRDFALALGQAFGSTGPQR